MEIEKKKDGKTSFKISGVWHDINLSDLIDIKWHTTVIPPTLKCNKLSKPCLRCDKCLKPWRVVKDT